MNAYGWCVIRASREPYRAIDPSSNAIDKLDEQIGSEDEQLAKLVEAWLWKTGEPSAAFSWAIHPQAWGKARVVTFTSSRNHRASLVWDLLEWITEKAPGSYGLVYVHDDEDSVGNRRNGRGNTDFSNQFRVFRMLNGKIDEFDDPFLSPIIPVINPTENC